MKKILLLIFITSSLSAQVLPQGFEHQYDSTVLHLYSYEGGFHEVMTFEKYNSDRFTNLGVDEGYHSVLIQSKKADDISYCMDFSSGIDSVLLYPGYNVDTLSKRTTQGLVIVDASKVDGMPTIQLDDGSVGLMSVYNNYYYAYVRQGKTAYVRYSIDGKETVESRYIYRMTVYQIQPAIWDIYTTDPFNKKEKF